MTRFADQLRRARAEQVAPCAAPVLVVGPVEGAPAEARRVSVDELGDLVRSGERFSTILTADALSSGPDPRAVAGALVDLIAPGGRLRFVERDGGRGAVWRVVGAAHATRLDVTGVLREAGATVVVCTRQHGPRGVAYASGVARPRLTDHRSPTGPEPVEETT